MPAVLATVLAFIARFLILRLITAFGIALVSGGISLALLQTFKTYILNGFATMTPEIYHIAMLAGTGYAMNIIFGAMAFKIALNVGKRLMFGVTGVGV
jgi:hypothetical protein